MQGSYANLFPPPSTSTEIARVARDHLTRARLEIARALRILPAGTASAAILQTTFTLASTLRAVSLAEQELNRLYKIKKGKEKEETRPLLLLQPGPSNGSPELLQPSQKNTVEEFIPSILIRREVENE